MSILNGTRAKVTNIESFEEMATVSVLDNAANNELDCFDNFTIQYNIDVLNDDGTNSEFLIAFQSTERNDGMMAYNGCELSLGCVCGYDADESQEFLEHMEHSDEADIIIAKLNSAANTHSKNSLQSFLEDQA